jgi:hypothetical protein
MGNANRGRRPDQQRRRQILKLREQGLSMPEIGRLLGITPQAVAVLLAHLEDAGMMPRYPVRCCACDRLIWADGLAPQNGAAHCLRCLARQPDVSFGTRLKAHRLAAKLTQRELTRRAGLHPAMLGSGCCRSRRCKRCPSDGSAGPRSGDAGSTPPPGVRGHRSP